MQTNLASWIKDTPEGRDADAILRKCVTVTEGDFEDIPAKHFPAIVKAVLGSLSPSLGN